MKIDRVTIAVTNMKQMVKFYNGVLDANIQPLQTISGFQFYGGKIAGIEWVMCPNELAEVDARQNRQQFRFVVDNIETVLAAVSASGGELLNDLIENDKSKTAGVRDPDGNTIEFIQYL